MQIGAISQYGFFDSKTQFYGAKFSPLREITEFEFDYILSCDEGAAAFINGKKYRLKPHTVIIRRPNDQSYSQLHFTCYCLHITLPFGSELYDEISNLPVSFTIINDGVYKSVFEQIFQHLTSLGGEKGDYFVLAKTFELFYHLRSDALINASANSDTLVKCGEAIRKVTTYIESNYWKKITLSNLGKLAGYSPNHLHREFKRFIGISPQKYIENVRISAAKLELTKREKSVAEIAYACGFSSQSHFTLAFKKATGMTPLSYRHSSEIVYE